MPASSRLTRIGVFYDGNYFLHVSNYYNYSHERRSRISISGLHAFIRRQVAEEEGVNERLCRLLTRIISGGGLNAHEANQRGNQLFYDRLFDDILMSEGVVTHYLPVKTYQGYGRRKASTYGWRWKRLSWRSTRNSMSSCLLRPTATTFPDS
jgi:hypothetical protein